MKKLLTALMIALIAASLLPVGAQAMEDEPIDGDVLYALIDEMGQVITYRAGIMYEGDECITADNQLYRVVSVDAEAQKAYARHIGEEPPVDYNRASEVYASADEKKKLIGMYCTHSAESYVPSDGAASKHEDAGIYDVAQSLKEELEELGVTVELDKSTHHPHDAKAYSRSRRTATKLLEQGPDALLDIHRDAIPVSHYETEVDGEETSKVRLLVGRSNPNASTNREFAKQLKKTADKKYPGLIKDIFIGKGNYNQELYPQSILLEFGTHKMEKERAISATSFMADVINDVVYGDTAKAAPSAEAQGEQNKSGATGIIWVIAIAAVGTVVYALISSGTLKRMAHKVSRGASEVTGGTLGKGPREDEDK